jgi:hypothetical protein
MRPLRYLNGRTPSPVPAEARQILGMAIKFAGLHGKEVHFIGKNRETFEGVRKPELLR